MNMAFLLNSLTKFPSLPPSTHPHPQPCHHRYRRTSLLIKEGLHAADALILQPNNKHFVGHQASRSLAKIKSNGANNLSRCRSSSIKQEHVKVEDHRPAHFPRDIWSDRFDNFTLEDQLRMERYATVLEPLKDEVRAMLLDNSMDLADKLNLIDTIERLGFSYYYEDEIKGLLDHSFNQLRRDNFDRIYDLYDTAVQFRVFRQHGYKMPSDVFHKFTDGEGKFKKELKSDERGMVSLFEATHLRVHGEDILEEALVFTTEFLTSIANSAKQARQALNQPLHRGNQRVLARHFISFYEEDKSHNETLLRLAKIEFNRLQLLHCQELSQVQRWWKNLDLARKLPHMRDRSVETHLVSIIMCYEPQYSLARILFYKIWTLLVPIDDTYDTYGTSEEIQQLNQAFQRWDLNLTEELSTDYLRIIYEFVINTCNEFDEEMTKRGKLYASYYAKEQVQEVIRNYYIESKWVESRYVPKFEEYMATKRITAGVRVLVTALLMGMEEVQDVKPYEQLLHQDPKVLVTCENMIRLKNDLVSGKRELANKGGGAATSIECYMKDHNIESREAVVKFFDQMIEDGWKDLVNEQFRFKSDYDHHVSNHLFKLILNYARAADVFYKSTDGYSYVNNSIKEDIIATYAQPFTIYEIEP